MKEILKLSGVFVAFVGSFVLLMYLLAGELTPDLAVNVLLGCGIGFIFVSATLFLFDYP